MSAKRIVVVRAIIEKAQSVIQQIALLVFELLA